MCIMTSVTTGGKLEKGGQLVYLDSIYDKSASRPLIHYRSTWAPLRRQKYDTANLYHDVGNVMMMLGPLHTHLRWGPRLLTNTE